MKKVISMYKATDNIEDLVDTGLKDRDLLLKRIKELRNRKNNDSK